MPSVAPPLPGIAAANREALARLVAADPVLVDCVPAGEALGLGERVVLHAGPPITGNAMCPPLRGAVAGALRTLPRPRGRGPDDRARDAVGRVLHFGADDAPVLETGITPLIDIGIAGRGAGTGQVGAGTVRAPLGCFTATLETLARARGVA